NLVAQAAASLATSVAFGEGATDAQLASQPVAVVAELDAMATQTPVESSDAPDLEPPVVAVVDAPLPETVELVVEIAPEPPLPPAEIIVIPPAPITPEAPIAPVEANVPADLPIEQYALPTPPVRDLAPETAPSLPDEVGA